MPPRVTTLNLVAQADPTMKFPLKTLKALISSRKEAVVHENLTMSDEELDDMNDKGVRPIMVHYVHGGPALSRSERS
jgi:hypothetical protein